MSAFGIKPTRYLYLTWLLKGQLFPSQLESLQP
jgi:hypothetical protein